MEKLTSKEIRQIWLNFWEEKKHEVIPSKSLIPINDQSLLWINSGVATLKDFFSGKKKPNNPRITNSQKSIRTNDIENVGVTARHQTLFEMLGNFSIGDYFKKEVIPWAWELLTEVYKLEKDKLFFTVFEEDQEAYDAWLKIGVDESHIIKGNRDMNFWDVGQGPCGPDTEIFYDRGEKYDPENIGIKLLAEDIENDRYIEIWNIVFSQLNNDGYNNYTDLAQKNIDTGAGLERIVSIFQDAPTNFDTDLFLPIIKEVEKLTGNKYDIDNYFKQNKEQTRINKFFRIIADHVRAISIAIEDGAKPSNTQRGYIIRRLLRRAYRSALLLGAKEEAFLYKLVPIVGKVLDVYPMNQSKVAEIIKKEELAFALTIKNGEELLEKELLKTKKEFSPEIAFKLFETYGFPIEITQEILEEKKIKLDVSKFEELKEKHASASRGKMISAMESQVQIIQNIDSKLSKFMGYTELETISKIIFQGKENGKWYVLLDKTPLYPTGGGQQCDHGEIDGEEVLDVFKDKYGNVWHILENKLEEDSNVAARVNSKIRIQKERNHSATHLLGFALSKIFGKYVIQLGSDNNETRLRFDFPLDKRPDDSKIKEVEKLVNKLINEDIKRKYIETNFNEAKKMGATSLEGEVYGDDVRVVKFNEVIDFCGGTHIESTKLIENFKITKFESKGSGIFRIEAITSNKAVQKYMDKQLLKMQEALKIQVAKNKKIDSKYSLEIPITFDEVEKALSIVKKDNKKLNKEKSNVSIDTNVEFTKYENKKAYINLNVDPSVIKQMAIQLREAHKDAIIIIGSPNGNRITLAVSSKNEDAKNIFDTLASKHNGKGGGNSDFAMGSMELFNL